MLRHDQLENMDMAIGAEQSVEMEQNALHFTGVEVMQETVDEDEVKAGAGRRAVGTDVAGDKLTAVTLTGILNVVWVDVYSQILGLSEILGVGARSAADIEDSADALHLVVNQEGGELLVGKRRLPEPVNRGLLEQSSG